MHDDIGDTLQIYVAVIIEYFAVQSLMYEYEHTINRLNSILFEKLALKDEIAAFDAPPGEQDDEDDEENEEHTANHQPHHQHRRDTRATGATALAVWPSV